MSEVFKVEGIEDTVANLEMLSKATTRNVLRRALTKGGIEVKNAAITLAPRRSGKLALNIIVSTKIKNTIGNAEFHGVLASGGSREEARSALIEARRGAVGQGSFAEVYVGPTTNVPYAHMVEFGTVKMVAEPYLRPAWESTKGLALDVFVRELKVEIGKAAARAARKAAKLAVAA